MKGQFFLLGFIIIGFLVITLSFSTFEVNEESLNPTLKNDIQNSIPVAVESFASKYKGREFMEMMQYFSERHKQESLNAEIEIVVIAGFEEGRNTNIHTGNYGSDSVELNLSVNGENKSVALSPQEITESTFEFSENYDMDLESDDFSVERVLNGPTFFVVYHKYQRASSVSQDTYIG